MLVSSAATDDIHIKFALAHSSIGRRRVTREFQASYATRTPERFLVLAGRQGVRAVGVFRVLRKVLGVHGQIDSADLAHEVRPHGTDLDLVLTFVRVEVGGFNEPLKRRAVGRIAPLMPVSRPGIGRANERGRRTSVTEGRPGKLPMVP